MIETSPALTTLQQQKLRGKNVRWATELEAQNVPVILLANELLDAFPVRQFQFKNGAWVERGFDAGLNDATRAADAPALPDGWQPEDGEIIEVNDAAAGWLRSAAAKVQAALFIDYGYTQVRHSATGSAQALHRHAPVALTHLPGQSDLTAHVNFAQAAGSLGGTTKLYDLAEFLLKYKILEAAEPTINTPETAAALHRLLHPTRMGALFKVLEYRQS